jgi:hypothetical protein
MRRALEHLLLAGIACVMLGFVGFATFASYRYGTEMLRAYVESPSWQTTAGTITSSRAVKGCARSGIGYYLEVKYRYNVRDREHASDKVWFGNGYCSGRSSVEAVASTYPAGNKVTVFFNPASPDESVLVRGQVANGTVFLFLLLLLAGPVGLIIFIWRTVSEARKQGRTVLRMEALLRRKESLDRGIRLEIDERRSESVRPKPPPLGDA